ncbi:sensor histidine kinase [Spirosoma gilvum]
MSLRSRIVLAVTVVFAGVSLLAGWLMLNRAEKSLQIAFDRAIQTRADWLLSLVSVDPVVLPLPTDRERMLVSYQTYGITRELFRSPGFPNTVRRGRHRQSFSYSYRSVMTQTTSNQLPDGQVLLTLAVPDATLQQDIDQLRWLFGIGWLVSLLLAFGAGYGVAGWLLRPIQAIVDQANTISTTGNSSRIQLPQSRDELYQLTDTLNQMLARIQENVELQRNFFGAAAHELRTPLTIMKTGLEVTLGNGRLDSATIAFLTGQLDEVSRLARLIDEFLVLSRPDALTQPLKLSNVDLSILLTNCLAQLTVIATDYEVKTKLDLAETIEESLRTDAVKLEHILLNLIENAIKYAVAGSVVSVQLERTETNWQLAVQNRTARESGPTLDLTEAYFRADPLKEGHGLGLWISFRLTTLLNGELRLNWQDFTFTSTLTLPVEPKK